MRKNISKTIIKIPMKELRNLFLFLSLFLFSATLLAEGVVPRYLLSNKAVSVGIGLQTEYDSYLSPLLYKGSGFTLMSERLKYFSLRSDKLSWYGEGNFQFGLLNNPAKNGTMIPFTFRYFFGVHRHFRPVENMNILVGAMVNMDLGGRFLMQNQNNPYSLNWNTNLWISVMGYYHLPLRKTTLTFREHFAMPVGGVMFSPKYMQTYYEIFSLGYTDNIIALTSFGGRLAWRNKVSMDLPVPFCTFRFGFLAERTVTNVNLLETRSTNLSLLAGFVYNFSTFRGNKPIPGEFHNPVW
jgi:hypothetical protein